MLSRVQNLLGFGSLTVPPPGEEDTPVGPALRLVLLMTVTGVFVVSISDALSWHSSTYAMPVFWLGVLLAIVPITTRLCMADVTRSERMSLVMLLAIGLFLIKLFKSPLYFDSHDEYIHWATLADILDRGRLFTVNPLMPVSPAFPGLELVSAALVQLSGLDVYPAALILVFALRAVLAVTLFLVFEKITSSPWVAGLACVVYMGNTNFIRFQTLFSYETLALQFLLAILLIETRPLTAMRTYWPALLCLAPLMLAAVMTHHLTSWIALAVVAGAGLLQLANGASERRAATFTIKLAVCALICGVWLVSVGGEATEYLGAIFARGLPDVTELFKGRMASRELFVSEDGVKAPLLARIVGIGSVALLSIGLAIGFFRALALKSNNDAPPRLVRLKRFTGFKGHALAGLLTAMTLLFPASVLLRLSSEGWEIANRMPAFIFLGVGLVVAIALVVYWLGAHPGFARSSVFGGLLAVVVIGGVVTGGPPDLLPVTYVAASDGASIEPLGVRTARWTRKELGAGWRFASDRVNRLLLATYGMQRVVTQIADRVELSTAFFNPKISSDDRWALNASATDFLLVDLRLGTAIPKLGMYFEAGETRHTAPPLQENLLKFDDMPKVSRTYDNGYIVIYDIRGLRPNAS